MPSCLNIMYHVFLFWLESSLSLLLTHYRFQSTPHSSRITHLQCSLNSEELNTSADRWHQLTCVSAWAGTCDHWHTVYDGIRTRECHCWSLMYCQMSTDPRGFSFCWEYQRPYGICRCRSNRRVSPTPRQTWATTHTLTDRFNKLFRLLQPLLIFVGFLRLKDFSFLIITIITF